MFRKRRARAAVAGAGDSSVPTNPGPSALGERLRAVAAAAAAPEDAVEPALQAVIEASGARAGALCLFDPRHGLLRLATEVGLSDEGCRALRNVRRGDPTSWDMPLHGLLNHRAYLIENPTRNRYVPRLVEEAAGVVRSVTCIPIYADAAPLGSLVLVSVAPRMFAERDIRALERPLRELGRMIESARRRAPAPAPAPAEPRPLNAIVAERDRLRGELAGGAAERDRLLGEVAAGLAERARLAAQLVELGGDRDRLRAAHDRVTTELERARREAERAEALTESLAAAETERARLAATLETMAAEQAREVERRAALEQAREEAERAAGAARADLEKVRRAAATAVSAAETRTGEHAAETAWLKTRLAEAEARAAEAHDRARDLDEERQRLAASLQVAAAREQGLREQLEATETRVQGAMKDDVHEAVAAARAAEEARAAAVAEAEAVAATLASTRDTVQALESDAARMRAEVARLEDAGRAGAAAERRLAVILEEGRARDEQATARIETLERTVEELRTERLRLTSALDARGSDEASLAARFEGMAAEHDRLRETLAGVEAERDGLAAERTAATVTQARLEEALARESAERARLGTALAAAQTAIRALETAQARHEAEAAEREASAAAKIDWLTAERDRLVAEHDRSFGTAVAVESSPAPSAPVEVVTVATNADARPRGRTIDPGTPLVAVIDTDPMWEDVAVDGHRVVLVAPGDGVAARFGEIVPARTIVNLAVPGAVEAVATLRANGATARVWGCIASAPGDRALRLGTIEVAAAPLDPDAVLRAFGSHATRGTRVITAGADVDALMSLRQALTRTGVSVSMAWDAKQAADLLGVVRPDVVVVDLALSRRDGYAIVAGLGAADTPPAAVLVYGEQDTAAGFAAVLEDPVHVGRAQPLDRFVAAVLEATEERAQRRDRPARGSGPRSMSAQRAAAGR